ncbi:MAG: PNGase F N-terminal domain-containing protein [Ferruginibacter sp.]
MRLKFISILIAFSGLVLFSVSSCKKDKAGSGGPTISVSSPNLSEDFGTVQVGKTLTKTLSITGTHLSGAIAISSSDGYTISFDTTSASFSGSISIAASDVASAKTMYIKFTPTVLGVKTGTLQFQSTDAETITVDLTGTGGIQRNYTTFSSEHLAFGSGFSQSAEHQYQMPQDVSTVNKINMYVKLRCPSGNCGDWDVYAHIQIKDPDSNEWYEMGRYITPYGVDNHALARGFEIDVTDFKSLLHGTVTLRAFIEVWTAERMVVISRF